MTRNGGVRDLDLAFVVPNLRQTPRSPSQFLRPIQDCQGVQRLRLPILQKPHFNHVPKGRLELLSEKMVIYTRERGIIVGYAQQFSIKDLEHFSGVKSHTIRMWEQRYGLLTPQRTATNIRYYSGEDLKKLLNVAMLLSNGYKISKVAAMGSQALADAVMRVQQEGGSHDAFLNMLKISMLNYDEALFRNVSRAYTEAHGFDRTVRELYLPFLSQVGILWLTDAICPAHEHFISHLLRQVIYARVESLPVPEARNEEPVVVHYLPELEIHDISLLFMHCLAVEAGKRSIFLGASVPFEDLLDVAKQFPSIHFVSYCTTVPSTAGAAEYVDKVQRHFDESPHVFHLGGKMFEGVQPTSTVHLYTDGGAWAAGVLGGEAHAQSHNN